MGTSFEALDRTSPDVQKMAAAVEAAKLVEPGMRLGLGTGSTVVKLIDALALRKRAGLDFVCVPTSLATQRLAEAAGLRLTTLDETPEQNLAARFGKNCERCD